MSDSSHKRLRADALEDDLPACPKCGVMMGFQDAIILGIWTLVGAELISFTALVAMTATMFSITVAGGSAPQARQECTTLSESRMNGASPRHVNYFAT